MMSFRRCGLLVLLISAAPVQAQWSGEIAAGYLATSGNTSTQSLNGKLGLDYTREAWKNRFKALSVYTTDQGEASAERYAASNKVDWNFGERNYVFASLDWEKDLFGGIRERTSETLGFGRNMLVGPTHLLELEIGAGARQSRENITGERDEDLILRGSALYTWKLSETSEFKQAVKVESGESNTFSELLSELKLSIIGNLFASVSYTLRSNTDVPDGAERTDSFTAVNLSYGFGAK
jgi:putative salt-induced outer membrane protein